MAEHRCSDMTGKNQGSEHSALLVVHLSQCEPALSAEPEICNLREVLFREIRPQCTGKPPTSRPRGTLLRKWSLSVHDPMENPSPGRAYTARAYRLPAEKLACCERRLVAKLLMPLAESGQGRRPTLRQRPVRETGLPSRAQAGIHRLYPADIAS